MVRALRRRHSLTRGLAGRLADRGQGGGLQRAAEGPSPRVVAGKVAHDRGDRAGDAALARLGVRPEQAELANRSGLGGVAAHALAALDGGVAADALVADGAEVRVGGVAAETEDC